MRQERATVQQGPRVGRGLPPPFGDGAGELPGDGRGQMGVFFPGGPGEAAFGQRVRRRLVLLPLGRLEADPGLVQRRTEKQLLDRDAGEPQAAGRLQVDLVERGGEVVGQVPLRELPERFGPGVRGLARRAEPPDGLPQFLHRGQAEVLAADLGDEGLDPAVILGPPQAVETSASRVLCRDSRAATGSAGGPSAMPCVRSSSRISGAVRRWRSLVICPASIASTMRPA